MFNDYDFEENVLGFRPRTVRPLAAARRRISMLHRAESICIDFHKTGFTLAFSSLFLVRDRAHMQLFLPRPGTGVLPVPGRRVPSGGVFTLETSRGGVGVLAAYANLHLFGRVGLRVLLGQLVEMAEALREHRDGHVSTTVLSDAGRGHDDRLPGEYPDGVDTWTIKDRERTAFGRGVRSCCATTTAPVEPNENPRPRKRPPHQRQQPRQQPDRPVGGDRLAVPQQRRAQVLLRLAVKARGRPAAVGSTSCRRGGSD